MPVKIDLTSITREVDRLKTLSGQSSQVIQRASTTLTRRIVPEARRDIQTEYALPAARINKGLSVRNTGTTVELTASGRGVGLVEFGAKQSRRGPATAQVLVGARKVVIGGFIATGLNGNRQVFKRVGDVRRMKAGNYVGRLKQPIQSQYGPSIAQMLRKGDREERLADYARDILSAEIDRLRKF